MNLPDNLHRAMIAEALDAMEEYVGRIDAPLLAGLRRYLEDRIETGGFLRRVLENDLREAAARAHPSLTLDHIQALCELIYNHFPCAAWGSPAAVDEWLRKDDPE